MARICAVVAMAENRVIGNNNQLPWHFPVDLKHFKEITTGHPIVMGRKTYQSIGRPLPNRTNIIITREEDFSAPGCTIVNSIPAALAAAKNSEEIMVIGGAMIFSTMLAQCERIYLTIIHHNFPGDSYFPELNPAEWQQIEKQDFPADAQNPYPYSFIVLDKVK